MSVENAIEMARAAMLRERAYVDLVLQGDPPEKARAWVNDMYIPKPLKADTAGMRAAIAAFLREAARSMPAEELVWASDLADEVEGGQR